MSKIRCAALVALLAGLGLLPIPCWAYQLVPLTISGQVLAETSDSTLAVPLALGTVEASAVASSGSRALITSSLSISGQSVSWSGHAEASRASGEQSSEQTRASIVGGQVIQLRFQSDSGDKAGVLLSFHGQVSGNASMKISVSASQYLANVDAGLSISPDLQCTPGPCPTSKDFTERLIGPLANGDILTIVYTGPALSAAADEASPSSMADFSFNLSLRDGNSICAGLPSFEILNASPICEGQPVYFRNTTALCPVDVYHSSPQATWHVDNAELDPGNWWDFPIEFDWDGNAQTTCIDPVGGFYPCVLPNIYWVTAGCSRSVTVTLTVTSLYTTPRTTSRTFSVLDSPQPTISWSLEPTKLYTVNFVGSNQSSCPASALSWQWTFGDGESSSTQNPTHTYSIPSDSCSQTYRVTAIASNSGCKVTRTLSLTLRRNPADTVDSDSDGLPDIWETCGIPMAGGDYYKLPGADPLHKDLFVEIDAMDGLAPDPLAISSVVSAFANLSDIPNPDGDPGVSLHVDLSTADVVPPATWGELEDYAATVNQLTWPAFYDLKRPYFGTVSERANPQKIAAKAQAYRYCLFINNFYQTTSGLARGIPSNDFLVALGSWEGATWEEQAGTFMHELGHALGLQHGGGDGTNYKPNYRSVMNYLYQTPRKGWPSQWALQYSNYPPYTTIDENALVESVSLGGCSGCWVPIGPPIGSAASAGFLYAVINEVGFADWNGNGVQDPGTVAPRDVNRFLVGSLRDPTDVETDLVGFDDQSHLNYLPNSAQFWTMPPWTSPSFASKAGDPPVLLELTKEQADSLDAMIIDCNGNGTADYVDIQSGTSSDGNGNDLPDECDPPDATPVILSSIRAAWVGRQVRIEWEMADASGIEIFAIYRGNDVAHRVRLDGAPSRIANHYEFTDAMPPTEGTSYWLVEIDRRGGERWFGPYALTAYEEAPAGLVLVGVTPSPVVRAATFEFLTATEGRTLLEVFTVSGRRVAMVFDGVLPAGQHRLVWSLAASGDAEIPSGLYFYRLGNGRQLLTGRVVVAR